MITEWRRVDGRRGSLPVRSLCVLLFLLPTCAPVAPIVPHDPPGRVGPAADARPPAPDSGSAAETAAADAAADEEVDAAAETGAADAAEDAAAKAGEDVAAGTPAGVDDDAAGTVARPDTISVAAFNIQVFGRSKHRKVEVMEVLTAVAVEVDVLFVQEIRDSSEQTADIFLEAINDTSEREYAMYEGPRLGRTSSKEQYVVYYAEDRARLTDAYTLPDPDDVFEREPLVATFTSGNFDFTVVGCHIKPDDAEEELRALSAAVDEIVAANPDERDVIVLGDLNADGSYLDERELTDIFPTDRYHVAISNDVDTMTTSDNTYDRIILRRETVTHEYVPASAQVFEFDRAYGLDDEGLVRSVSDHYPVLARFRITAPDDDGS